MLAPCMKNGVLGTYVRMANIFVMKVQLLHSVSCRTWTVVAGWLDLFANMPDGALTLESVFLIVCAADIIPFG